MYKLKTLSYNYENKSIVSRNGILCLEAKDEIFPLSQFWGNTEINIGTYADENLMKEDAEKDDESFYLTYAIEYKSEEEKDGFKKLTLSVSTPGEVKGYIVFIPYSGLNIKTSGEKLFGRYPTEIVAVLKEDDYLTFSGRTLMVMKNQLVCVL